jgi:hypothetical protein
MSTVLSPTHQCAYVVMQEPVTSCNAPCFSWSFTGPNGPWVSLCLDHIPFWPFKGSGEFAPLIRLPEDTKS